MRAKLLAWATAAAIAAAALACPAALAEAPLRGVVALSGSLADLWRCAGGELSGYTLDAAEEWGFPADGRIVGTTHSPSLEMILAAPVDLVLTSPDSASHAAIRDSLAEAGVDCLALSLDSAADFEEAFAACCALTGREDLMGELEAAVTRPVAEAIGLAKARDAFGTQMALLLRAYSGGVKAKGSDSLAGSVLRDMGLVNAADGDSRLSENLSLEAVVVMDPDWIFVVTMGEDEAAALRAFEANLSANPAWSGLTAVREGRCVFMPKALFQQKPNLRWGEAYRWVLETVYEVCP